MRLPNRSAWWPVKDQTAIVGSVAATRPNRSIDPFANRSGVTKDTRGKIEPELAIKMPGDQILGDVVRAGEYGIEEGRTLGHPVFRDKATLDAAVFLITTRRPVDGSGAFASVAYAVSRGDKN